jgi:hypothetical protein
VVALNRGGAQETVIDGETGTLVNEGSAPAFSDAIAQTVGRAFDPAAIRRHAERFSRTRFGDEMQALIEQEMDGVAKGACAGRRGVGGMLRRHNRLLVTLYALSDAPSRVVVHHHLRCGFALA